MASLAGSLSSLVSHFLHQVDLVPLAAMGRLMVVIPLDVDYEEKCLEEAQEILRGLLPGCDGRWNLLNEDTEEREFSLIGLQQINEKANSAREAFVQAVYALKNP